MRRSTRQHALRVSGERVAVALVVLLGVLLVVDGNRPRTASAAGAPACAVPGDCRLREAARSAGLRFGLASVNGSAQHKATLVAEADVSVNHELSWSGIEPDRGVWDFTKADDNYQFAVDHGLYQIGMHFAWDQALVDDMPGWVGTITDPGELRDVLRIRAETIFARYPALDRIDVINEPFETLGSTLYQNHFAAVLGPDYIDELFSIVEAAAPPTVELFVNEGGIDYQPDKADALVGLIAHLIDDRHRVDAVGLQTHLSVGEPNWQVLYDTMRRLDALGVRPFISEVDVPVPATVPDREMVQAERYRRVTELCLAVPACDLIDVWGVSDADTWYDWALYPDLDPNLFDESFAPKPSYDAVRSALLTGRPPPGRAPAFLTPATDERVSGDEAVIWSLACRASSSATETGYGEIAHVTHLFVAGNPVRLPLAGTARWTADATADGTITYALDLELDLAERTFLSREETARPAVGLGGHLDLVDSVWLQLHASDLRLRFAPPVGATPVGTPSLTDSDGVGATAEVADGGVVVRVPRLDADSRRRTGPLHLAVSWQVAAAVPRAAGVVTLPAPTLDLDIAAGLGVVFQGIEVLGGATSTMHCVAEEQVPVLASAVGAAEVAAVLTPAFTG